MWSLWLASSTAFAGWMHVAPCSNAATPQTDLSPSVCIGSICSAIHQSMLSHFSFLLLWMNRLEGYQSLCKYVDSSWIHLQWNCQVGWATLLGDTSVSNAAAAYSTRTTYSLCMCAHISMYLCMQSCAYIHTAMEDNGQHWVSLCRCQSPFCLVLSFGWGLWLLILRGFVDLEWAE